MGALAPFRMPLEARADGDPAPLPHLSLPDPSKAGIALQLYADLLTKGRAEREQAPVRVVRTHFKHQYWSFEQALTHQTSNGCNIRSGDLIGSGTVSGPAEDAAACLLEITEAGSKPLALNGETRTFLEDGDEVILTGQCLREGFRTIELGMCRGRIEPARTLEANRRERNP
jgi:fumarylacetoacetase